MVLHTYLFTVFVEVISGVKKFPMKPLIIKNMINIFKLFILVLKSITELFV